MGPAEVRVVQGNVRLGSGKLSLKAGPLATQASGLENDRSKGDVGMTCRGVSRRVCRRGRPAALHALQGPWLGIFEKNCPNCIVGCLGAAGGLPRHPPGHDDNLGLTGF